MLAVENECIMGGSAVGRSQVRFRLAAKCSHGKCCSTDRTIVAMSRASGTSCQYWRRDILLMCPSHITYYRRSLLHCLAPQTDNSGSTSISSLPSNILGSAYDYTHRRTTSRPADRGQMQLVDREDQRSVLFRVQSLVLVANSSCQQQMRWQIRHCKDTSSGHMASRFPSLLSRRHKCECNLGRTRSIDEACNELKNDIGVSAQLSKDYGHLTWRCLKHGCRGGLRVLAEVVSGLLLINPL
jgi:hypothetical protein